MVRIWSIVVKERIVARNVPPAARRELVVEFVERRDAKAIARRDLQGQ
jgi:hypothetical protein